MVELNADRTPPVYYKELTYDAEGESSINDLEPVLSGNYTADERLCLRFVVELYKMPGATDDVNKGNLVERREISVERLTDAPQDTLYFCLADGNYKVLAWADLCRRKSLPTGISIPINSMPLGRMYLINRWIIIIKNRLPGIVIL